MNNSIKINLAGIVFQIEEDAYRMLREYLNAIERRLKNTSGGNEALDDIETRIAEIFQSQKGLTGIISKENVEAMIGIIGKPEDFEQLYDQPSDQIGYKSARRRLYRNPDDSIIGGVCGGIGAYLNIDPVWIRLLFIIFTFSFGIGILVYIALWIALPSAVSDSQKRELYGEYYISRNRSAAEYARAGSSGQYSSDNGSGALRNAGNALNEVFNAIGKFFYVVGRIILIAFGVCFVLLGFASLVTFIMVFFFKYPWFFFDESVGPQLFYLPDILDFVLDPGLAPWVIILITLALVLPLLGIIYWGLKMIFWFRVRDWIVSLVALVIWVMSISALALILFNQGISFANRGNHIEQTELTGRHDTLYLKIDRKISSLKYDQEITLPENEYSLFINRNDNRLYGRPELEISVCEEPSARISIERYSHGKTRLAAVEKAESFIYNYRISGDTVYLDQYYEVPTSTKWSGSWVEIDIEIPEGTVLWIDKDAEPLFNAYPGNEVSSWELGGRFWRWGENGPERIEKRESK